MAGQNTVNQLLQLQIMGTNDVVNAINRVVKSQDRYAKALLRTSKQQKNTQKTSKALSDQGLANIQAGLVQLSTYLLNMNVKINNVFESMQKGFAKTETSMNILKTTMGLASKSSAEDLMPFTEASSKISQLALTTEYTKSEIADAFSQMKRDGLDYSDAIGVIDKTLQFATASAGLVSLKEASEITTLTFKTLGGGTKDMGKNLNKLFKITQDSSLGVDDLREALSGLRSVSTSFGDSTLKESTLLTFLGALMEQGESAANAGLKLKNFGQATTGLYTTLSALQTRMAVGSATKKVNLKNLAILRLAGVFNSEEALNLVNTTYKKVGQKTRKVIGDTYSSVAAAVKKDFKKYMPMLNKFAISKLYTVDTEGKASLKSIEGFSESILAMYKSLKAEDKEVVATSTLKTAFGTEAGSATIKAIQSFLKRRGDIGLIKYAQGIDKNLNELGNAQADALKTLEKRIKLSESAESALSESIFKHDVYAKAGLDTYTELVKATGLLMKNNESLASTTSFLGRSLQLLTGVGTNLGFMLTAAATFSIALGHSQKGLAAGTKGLGSTMRAFGKVFLMPTVAVVGQLTGGLVLLGLGIVATMKYFSGSEGLGKGFKTILDKISMSAKGLGGMFQAMFSKDLGGRSITELTKKFYELRDAHAVLIGKRLLPNSDKDRINKKLIALGVKQEALKKIIGLAGSQGLELLDADDSKKVAFSLAYIMDTIKVLASTLSRVFEGMLIPIVASLGVVFGVLGAAVQVLLAPFKVLAYFFSDAGDEASITATALKIVGFALGGIVSTILLFKTFSFFFSTITTMGNKFIGLKRKINNTAGGYKNLTNAIKQNSQAQSLSPSKILPAKQLTFLEKLRLKYKALTGQIKDHNQAVRNSVSPMDQIRSKGDSLKGAFDQLSLKIGGAGLAMIGLGEAFTYFGASDVGSMFTKIGTGLLMLAPIITLLTTLMGAFGVTIWVALGWLIGAIAAITALAYYFTDSPSEKSNPAGAISTGSNTTLQANNSLKFDDSKLSINNSPPQLSTYNSYNPSSDSITGGSRIETQIQRQYKINNVNVYPAPGETKNILDNLDAPSMALGETRST
jgi:hypothetical protein